MRRSVTGTVLALAAVLVLPEVPAAASERSIVIVGGPKSEGPLRHDYPNGVRILEALIEAAPQLRGLPVVAYPDGWPSEPDAFERAAVIVWYFDGAERHPLLDAGRRARFDAAMGRGVGLVALHQASTVPAGNDPGLARWLGAARHGFVDRVDEIARLVPAPHPVTRGLAQPFEHFDEFYPTLRFAPGAVPVLASDRYVAAWAFERAGGGRSIGFTGAHYLLTLDRAPIRTLLLNAIAWASGREVPAEGVASSLPAAARPIAERLDSGTFHHDAQRSGWNPMETTLTPERVAAGEFGLLWRSEPFAGHQGQAPRLYATPLYFDRIRMARGNASRIFSVVYAATNHGDVYAVNAFPADDVPAGAILWHRKLGEPCRLQPAPLDGVPTGVLATPAVDAARNVLYVTHCDPVNRWQAYALDLGTGALADGWPIRLDEATFNAPGMNRNAGDTVLPPRRRFDFRVQRAALNLSPDGRFVYVAFGETETGWLVAIDTATRRVASTFATQAIPHRGSGGIWGAGGPAVDASGRVYVVTGTGYEGYVDNARDWTQSVLALDHGPEGFVLRGTYTPFNHCDTARADIDLGSGGASLVPGSDWLVVGGKQGNVYLLDRTRLPGRLDRRPACSTEAARDTSFLPPGAQPQFGTRGPLNVFGPYSERDAAMDLARARSVPANFRDERGRRLVFVTGNTKRAEGSPESVPPSIARLEIVEEPAPHLRIDQVENTLVFENPGSPLVSSNESRNGIVWVLDENARRSASLAGPDAPRPVLHALDALTLKPLWRSRPGELATSGKYNEPVVARGRVFVGTDRIQAFGIGPRLVEPEPQARATPPAAVAANPGGARDGRTVYAERCATCHDHPQGSIPPRAVIAARPHARIVEALTTGSMRPHAAGLGAAEIDAVARYLQ